MRAILPQWFLPALAALAAGLGSAPAGAEECLSGPSPGASASGCVWELLPTQSYCLERVRGVGPLRRSARCGALRADGEREVFVLRTAAGKTYLPPNSRVIVEQGAGSNVFWAVRTGAGEAMDVSRWLEHPDGIPLLAIGGAGAPRGGATLSGSGLKTLGRRIEFSGTEGGGSQRTSVKP